jgi:hypothetical protein
MAEFDWNPWRDIRRYYFNSQVNTNIESVLTLEEVVNYRAIRCIGALGMIADSKALIAMWFDRNRVVCTMGSGDLGSHYWS